MTATPTTQAGETCLDLLKGCLTRMDEDGAPFLTGPAGAVAGVPGDVIETGTEEVRRFLDGLDYPIAVGVDRLSPGGFRIFDDHALPTCRKAVDDVRAPRSITEPVETVGWTGAFRRQGSDQGERS